MTSSRGLPFERLSLDGIDNRKKNVFSTGWSSVVVAVLATSFLLAAEAPGMRGMEEPPNANETKKRLREGLKLEGVSGRIEPAGDRFAFVAENSSARYILLENLNLERIVKMADVYPVPIRWTISGVITEFEKQNFLFIETATFSSLFRKADDEPTNPSTGSPVEIFPPDM